MDNPILVHTAPRIKWLRDMKKRYPMEFEHDWYSLIYIIVVYFEDLIYETCLEEYLRKHQQTCAARVAASRH
jgi:hypothetical protein